MKRRDVLVRIAAALAPHGLIPRGGFNFTASEGAGGKPAKSVLLVGHAGADYWPHFSRWRDEQASGLKNPLDTWSRNVIGQVAEEFGASAVSPSDRPHLPFQQWACRAEGLKPSPLGILVHPVYGLWHAYRGALLFDEALLFDADKATASGLRHPCDLCVAKRCLSACPVDARSPSGFAYKSCVAHVRSDDGQHCRDIGCLARNACPHGAAYRYPADMQAFHMASLVQGSA